MKKSYSLTVLFCSLISLGIAINANCLEQNEPVKKANQNINQKKIAPKKAERLTPPAENNSAKKSTVPSSQSLVNQPIKK